MDWLEILLKVLVGWGVVSVLRVLGWSRFVARLQRMDRQVADHAIQVSANQVTVYQRAA